MLDVHKSKKIVHLISGPRNISTALMYSFGNRQDTVVVDEPFYASYLTSHPDVAHPGTDDILNSQSNDFDTVKSQVIFGEYEVPNLFVKNMAHHLDNQDWNFLLSLSNVFLIRSPQELIASFAKVIKNPTLLDIGLKLEWQIFNFLNESGQSPIVIDSNDILKSPKKLLSNLCDKLEIPFDPSMLTWTPGPRKEDGIWAKYWYKNVHASSTFSQKKVNTPEVPKHLGSLLDEANKYYELLSKFSIK